MAQKVLFLAADSGEGQYNYLVDPALKAKLEQDEIHTRERFISAVSADDLTYFDTIVIMRTPVQGHAKNDIDDYQKLLPCINDFVNKGGNLLIMFAECYGKTITSLNELGAFFDIKFGFNKVTDSNESNCSALPNMPEGRLIKCNMPINNASIDIVVDGGHGTQQLTCYPGESWKTLIEGSETCLSEAFPQGLYAGSCKEKTNSPVFACQRSYGKGRVTAFPASSAIWIANSYLPRWQGYLMEQNKQAGYALLKSFLSHKCAVTKDISNFKDIPLTSPAEFSFKALSSEEQKKIAEYKSFKFYLGSLPDNCEFEEAVIKAHHEGYSVMALIHDYTRLDNKKWQDLCKQYKETGNKYNMVIVPALEQLDAEGNCCVVFNVEELPELRRRYPNSNMLEDLLVKLNGYSAVYARAGDNRIPAWRHGGYNLLEVADPADLELYHDRVSSGAFLSALHIARNTLQKKEKMHNWLLAENLFGAMNSIRENRHLNYISSGPQIEHFMFEGPDLIDDDWEGFWYSWESGDELNLKISISADTGIKKVLLYDGDKLYKKFTPGSKVFETEIKVKIEKDMRFHLRAFDEEGGALDASYPLYTRNRFFWAHMGSDQMNDYHNVFNPDPKGSIGVKDRFYEPCGFVTCGFAWGDYVRITPPVPWKDIMPQGIEVSSLVGNFQSFHPSPFIVNDSSFDFLNDHRRTLGKSTQNEHILYSDSKGCWLEQPEAHWKGHNGRRFKPTRNLAPSNLWQCRAKYTIPSWKPYGRSMVVVEAEIEWLKSFEFSPETSFSLGHSFHRLKDDLRLNAGCLQACAVDFISQDMVDDYEGEKEWDNLGMIKLLRSSSSSQTKLLIPEHCSLSTSGDAMGNFSFDNIDMPGQLFVRGWKRHGQQFVISYELIPEQKSFAVGDKIRLKYSISVYGS